MPENRGDIGKNVSIVAILILTIIAGIARFYHLGFQGLTPIENYTYLFSTGSLFQILNLPFTAHENPPMYYLLAWITMHATSDGAIAIRLPATICGILYIPAIYLLGEKFHSRILGLLSAAAVTISFPLIYYSQDAKPYTLILLVFAGVMWLFIGLVRGEKNLAIPFCILSVLCIWVHFFSIVPLIVMWVYLIATKRFWSWILIPVSCTFPFADYYFNVMRSIITNIPVKMTGYWFTWDLMLRTLPFEFFGYAEVPMLVLYTYGLYRNWSDTLVKIFTATVAISILFVIASTFMFESSPRYVLLVLPMVLLVAMIPVAEACRSFTQMQVIVVVAAIFYIIAFLNYHPLDLWYSVQICNSGYAPYDAISLDLF
jgi:hypothetical protein